MTGHGEEAERLAAQYLQLQGLKLIVSNYRSRFGEIDLIMQEGMTLVFIEVRLRRNENFGGADASIDRAKQKRIILTAQHYLASLARTPPCRFDAVLLNDVQENRMRWLKNAFDA